MFTRGWLCPRAGGGEEQLGGGEGKYCKIPAGKPESRGKVVKGKAWRSKQPEKAQGLDLQGPCDYDNLYFGLLTWVFWKKQWLIVIWCCLNTKPGWQIYFKASAVVFCAPVKLRPWSSRVSGSTVLFGNPWKSMPRTAFFIEDLRAKGTIFRSSCLAQETHMEVGFTHQEINLQYFRITPKISVAVFCIVNKDFNIVSMEHYYCYLLFPSLFLCHEMIKARASCPQPIDFLLLF